MWVFEGGVGHFGEAGLGGRYIYETKGGRGRGEGLE
jgi:hypothetical protein